MDASICVITSLRIVFTVMLIRNPLNASYWVAPNGLCLILEPLLGIINACIPLLGPLKAKFRLKSWLRPINSKSRIYGDGGVELKSKDSSGLSHFKRLEGSHAHTFRSVSTEAEAEAESIDQRFSAESKEQSVLQQGRLSPSRGDRINVTRDWTVSTQLAH